MQEGTPETEDLDPDTTEGEPTMAARLGRVEGQVDDIGTALDLASKLAREQARLALEQNELLRRVARSLSTGPPLP